MTNDLAHVALSRRLLLGASAATAAAGLFGPSLLTHGARTAGAVGEVLTRCHWGAFYAKTEPAYQPIGPLCVDGPAGEPGGFCGSAG